MKGRIFVLLMKGETSLGIPSLERCPLPAFQEIVERSELFEHRIEMLRSRLRHPYRSLT